jgi:hypothetical protein
MSIYCIPYNIIRSPAGFNNGCGNIHITRGYIMNQYNILKKLKFVISTILLVFILVLLPISTIFAHSPVFAKENHDPSHAYQINDFTKSWVIYATLDHPDKGDYYKFSASKGDRIYISLMTSQDPEESGFLPSFALLVPNSGSKDELPVHIDIPPGLGAIVIDSKNPAKAEYEPFTPGWLYDLSSLDIDAPEDGVYYIVVFDQSQKTGNYSLAVGFIESFTFREWIMIPFSVHNTYAWEGQDLFITYLPIILTVVIGSILLFVRKGKGKGPTGLSKWLAAFAGLTFLGTSLSILYQMVLALSTTGFTAAVTLTIIISAIGIVLSLFALLYALSKIQVLTIGKRILLIIIGIISIFSWSGLFIGAFLVMLAAVVPPYNPIRKY